MDVFLVDEIVNMYEIVFRMFEELGIKVFLFEVCKIYVKGGVQVDESIEMVYIGCDMVEVVVVLVFKLIKGMVGVWNCDIMLELGLLVFQSGVGVLNVMDLECGCRSGLVWDYKEYIQLIYYFDVFQMILL